MNRNHVDLLKNMGLPLEKLKSCKILITGANGLIASNLVEALMYLNDDIQLDLQVYALCRNEKKAKTRFMEFLETPSFHLFIQDVIEPLRCDIAFDYIIHAASAAHPGAFNTVPVDVMKANFLGTLNLLEYSRRHHPKGSKTKFMFVSSSEVYGENFEGVECFTEEMNGSVNPDRFRSCYPESKRASETLCLCYKQQYDSHVLIVRPAFIYGKEIVNDNVRADAYFLRQVLNHQDIVMYSEGKQVRSYLYIYDCVSAMLFVLLKGINGGVYNIGNDKNIISLHDYALKLAQAGRVHLLYEPKTEPENITFLKTTRCILNVDKLRALGWKPCYTLDEGITEILNDQ